MLSNKCQKLAGFGLVILVCLGIGCNSKSNDGAASGTTGSSNGSSQAVSTPGGNSAGGNVTSQGQNVTSQGDNVTSSTTVVPAPAK
jgi:hypothetical protein